MQIFKVREHQLLPLKEIKANLEKDVQRLTEANLASVFSLRFVSTEFSLRKFRIDTLAFDEETNSFVIIEYKRDRSFSVIDQGYSYLALMLNNKADFILEYNERVGSGLRREDVDWSQSKVIFVANSFTTYQQNAINFRDLPIELWEVRIFDNGIVAYNQLVSPESTESIRTVSRNKTIEKVSDEVKVYTLEDHLAGVNSVARQLFSELRNRIQALDSSIEERPKKKYIAYRVKIAFAWVKVQRARLKIFLLPLKSDLQDPRNLTRDVTDIRHHGGGKTEVLLEDVKDLNYVMSLIEQSYQTAA